MGSATSGNYGHAGRPGEVGGSGSGGGAPENTEDFLNFFGAPRDEYPSREANLGESVVTFGMFAENDPKIDWYLQSGHKGANDLLRNPDTFKPHQNPDTESFEEKSLVEQNINQIERIIDRAPPLPKGTTLYRGVGEKTGELMAKAEIGAICKDDGFQSNSINPNVARIFTNSWGNNDVTIVRSITNGQKGIYTNKYREEEVVLNHGLEWRVVAKDEFKEVSHGLTAKSDVLPDERTYHIITVVPA